MITSLVLRTSSVAAQGEVEVTTITSWTGEVRGKTSETP